MNGIVIMLILQGCSSCDNDFFQTTSSPSQKYSAVIFNRDCGATTGFSTQLSIIKYGDNLSNNGGNILVIDNHPSETNINVEWISDIELTVSNLGENRIYNQEHSLSNVKISYE